MGEGKLEDYSSTKHAEYISEPQIFCIDFFTFSRKSTNLGRNISVLCSPETWIQCLKTNYLLPYHRSTESGINYLYPEKRHHNCSVVQLRLIPWHQEWEIKPLDSWFMEAHSCAFSPVSFHNALCIWSIAVDSRKIYWVIHQIEHSNRPFAKYGIMIQCR